VSQSTPPSIAFLSLPLGGNSYGASREMKENIAIVRGRVALSIRWEDALYDY